MNFDLNLIRVFLAVARCGNVSVAGDQLGLTQSSVSHALGRLRAICNDKLFINTSKGMVPTPAAEAMMAPLAEALELATRTVRSARSFDPATEARNFVLILSEMGELSYVPPLIKHLSSHAPGITISIVHMPAGAHYEALAHGKADLAIGTFPAGKPGFHEDTLFDQHYVCMLRAAHPSIHSQLSLAQYFEATHVVVHPPGRGPDVVDQALDAMGRNRRVVVQLQHFLAGPSILRDSAHLMSVPAWTWRILGSPPDIKCLPLPFDCKKITARTVWHERVHQDAANQWLRAAVHSLLTTEEFTGDSGMPVGSS